MKKKLLIIGGLGFLGNALVNSLHKKYQLIIIDKKKPTKKFLKMYKSYKLRVYQNLKYINKIHNIYAIFYKAGILGGPKSSDISYSKTYLYNNFESLIYFLNKIKNLKIKKFFFDSTEQIYQEYNYVNNNEYDEPQPSNFYGFSKLLCEKYLLMWSKTNKTKVIIIRYPRVIGKNKSNFISKMAEDCVKKKFINLKTKKNKFISFLNIKDANDFNINMIEKKTSKFNIFNLRGDKPIKLVNVAKRVASLKNKKAKIFFSKTISKTFEPTNLGMSNKLTYKSTKWKAKYKNFENINYIVENI